MFDSRIAAKDLIDELKSEIDVAIPISNESYVESLNSLEQLLYTEVIKEINAAASTNDSMIDLSQISVSEGEKNICFEDIHTVYAVYESVHPVMLKKASPILGSELPECFYKYRNKLVCHSDAENVTIMYYVRPTLKTVNPSDVVQSGNVMLPVEFIDLAKAKLRADAYKIANEDAFAAKWMNDYNVLLETFKVWVESKRANFGF